MKYFRVHFKGYYSSKSDEPGLDVEGDHGVNAEVYPNKSQTIKLLKDELGLHYAQIIKIDELTKE